jgi:energy-coupling factor transporter transmembrane protein EcfT
MLIMNLSTQAILRVWKNISLLLLIMLIIYPLFISGGLLIGISYALRFAIATFAMWTLLHTTPINTLIRGFEKLGLSYNIALAIGIALQYFEKLGVIHKTISEAQQTRGWDPKQQNIFKRLKSMLPQFVALIISALRQSDTLALSLATRGWHSIHARTYREDIKMAKLDWGMMAGLTIGFLIVICFFNI